VGFHAVLGLLEGEQPVDAVWLQKGKRDHRSSKILAAARARGLRVEMVPRARLDHVAGAVSHNGCAARASEVAYLPLQSLVAAAGEPGRLLLVDDLMDPHNLGAVVRSSAAFGVHGIVVAGPSAPPLAGAVAKAAAGYLGTVPMARAKVAADALQQLKEAGYWAYGAAADGLAVAEVDPGERWVLCVGAEAHGLRAKTRSAIDEFVAIPMAAGVESLNLSVSAGILLYEFCLRRG
jgi:23S rRNA (guanosine2251-2'-O)-methyltransferase